MGEKQGQKNREYIETLLILGAIPSHDFSNLKDLIESEVDIRKYHETALKFIPDFKEEIRMLEYLDFIYLENYKGLNKFLRDMEVLLKKFILCNKNNERMLNIFKEHIYDVIVNFKQIILEKEDDINKEMNRALKIFFNPKLVMLDKVYMSRVNDSDLSLAVTTLDLYDKGSGLIKDRNIGMIGFKDGNSKIYKIDTDYDKLKMWNHIKINLDSYDFIYVCNKDKSIDKFISFMNYLKNNKEGLTYGRLLELDRLG